MKKNYLLLIATLMLNALMFAQTVTLTPTAVNNTNVNSGPINLASLPNSTISLNIKVDIPSNVAVNDQGTLTVYYSNLSTSNANVAAGGNGGNLYFGGGKTATRSMVINLYWSDFLTSGGFIFAEYKTPAGTAYRSSNLAVIKNSTMSSGTTLNPPADAPNPTKIPNSLCCNQIVRLGDKPQIITGSKFLNPYEKEPYGISSKWETKGNASLNIKADFVNQTLDIDHITSPENFTVKRSLGYVYGNQYPNTSNTVTITVVPSPILTNDIMTNDTPNSDGIYELSSVKTLNLYGFNSMINLNILQDPNHTHQRGDNVVRVDSYKWEYKDNRLYSNPWIAIPNENGSDINFSAPSQIPNSEDINYLVRRIAIYKNVSRVSNEIKILVRALRYNNTICCDQILKIQSETSFENPKTIDGSIAEAITPIEEGINFRVNYVTYQWQSLSKENGYSSSTWTNIPGATSKDYLPSQTLTVVRDRRGKYNFAKSYIYRRIAYINYSVLKNKLITKTALSYSNESSIDGSVDQAFIQLYPNPATSILNIESTVDISNSKVTISNITGNILNSNNFSIINPKLISINVSNFITGTYFITIENQNLGLVQRTFIKQ
ncbi:Por secretion system C-terminal sorting domain-containing protein [Flavobacterium anhuiense]|uniref:Por secretion system C-terminal sorting domain-containing protein n=1 Tax=Flavobacterium anhuiense TaxID=459526 RepID=A0A444VUP6_9FLAO|nr:T9SS type A sorting domain-containing protein [Flavobacterium anhuiense]RYJ37365.1 Por secretion system C-terminal sorting domain-containing protein [Flavobacterium anhuiense]